jgi:microcystin-dependent protein
MSDYFLGEIRMFPMGWPPSGWALCDGATLSVSQYQALFTLLGKQYGGDGVKTFNLPDLRGRAIVGAGVAPTGTVYQQGVQAGSEQVTLTSAQIPIHSHYFQATADKSEAAPPSANYLASAQDSVVSATPNPVNVYSPATTGLQPLIGTTIGNTGGGQPHDNMQPFLAVNYCISMTGIYPMRP